jgi:hypothetical protein
MFNKVVLFFVFVFVSLSGSSQNDTLQTRGTIKISKAKKTDVFIKAYAYFYDYDLEKIKSNPSNKDLFQPFPVVEGYSFPFNYTAYFNEKFKGQQIDLNGKRSDTVIVELRILSNGKVYLSDQKKTVKDIDPIRLYPVNFLNEIKVWFPAYVLLHKRSKYKGQTVIKPYKKKVSASGKITIIFSNEDFEN